MMRLANHRLIQGRSAVTPQFPTGSALTQVQPFMAQSVVDAYGVAAHPLSSASGAVYLADNAARLDKWMSKLAAMNATYFRGLCANSGGTAQSRINAAAAKAREYGIQWLMLVCPEQSSDTVITSNSEADTRAYVRWIADNVADICYGIESVNEPNNNRGSSPPPVPGNWATQATNHTRYIREEVDSYVGMGGLTLAQRGVEVVGPSLHDTKANNSYNGDGSTGGLEHWHQLAAAGLGSYMDSIGMHRYPAGWEPTRALGSRLTEVRDAFGAGVSIWITETGYHTHLNTTRGHKPIDEAGAARYAKRAMLELICGGSTGPICDFRMVRYELLAGVVDPGDTGDHEPWFGVVDAKDADPATWTDKPEVAEIADMLGRLSDPGADFTPATVGCEVTGGPADLQWWVTAKRNGDAEIHLVRADPFWDPVNEVNIGAGLTATDTTVTDDAGSRVVSVGADVVHLALR